MTPRISQAANIANTIKKQLKDLVVVVGGAHATVDPVGTLHQFPTFDIAVVGEGKKHYQRFATS
jgi:radical SAM superfamily enzyme YgiQ (UPF0313 family)